MKRLVILSAIILGLGLTASVPKTAECVSCPAFPCFGAGQCLSCHCLKKGLDMQGVCVSFEHHAVSLSGSGSQSDN